jgi:hypothetical protein
VAQLFNQLLFKCRRNSVLQSFSFVMNLIPIHPKDLGEHSLDQVMADYRSLCDLATLRR